MSKGKGWFLESRRHKLSALGIKTGRKMLPKKPISLLVGDQKMFYPKKKEVSSIYEAPIEQIRKGFNEVLKYPKTISSSEKINKALIEAFQVEYKRIPTQAELNEMLLGWRIGTKIKLKKPLTEYEMKVIEARKLSYPKNNRGKKIVKGAVIGAVVGALAYKGKRQRMSKQAYQLLKSVKVDTKLKSAEKKVLVDLIGANQLKTSKQLIKAKTDLLTLRKGNPLPKGTRYAFDSIIKTGKYKGLRPRYAFKNNKVIEIVYFRGKKKMATKKLNYNDDVTYAQPTVSGVEIPEKVGFLKKLGRGAVAVGKGAKATFEKGQEIGAKLRKIQEEREVRDIARTQRQLLKAQSQLQVVKQKKLLEATKKEIEAGRESILPKIF